MSSRHTRKIVVIGPESTGKSTLCEQLAARYGTVWCPEYAREYLDKLAKPYGPEDLPLIAKGRDLFELYCLSNNASAVPLINKGVNHVRGKYQPASRRKSGH